MATMGTEIPVIELDFPLLGRVLTQYGQYIGHIPLQEFITVSDLEYNQEDGILTVFINLEKPTMN